MGSGRGHEANRADHSTVLKLKVVPGSSRNEVVGKLGDNIKVAVTSPPEKGKANKQVIEILSKALRIPEGNIRIERGSTRALKTIMIRGLTNQEVLMRLGFG